MKLLVRLLINAVALGITFFLVDLCWDGSVFNLILVALVFGLVNALIRPLITILTCPAIILTLGLFVLVINALMLWLTIWISESVFELGFSCTPDFFWNIFFGAIVLSLVSWGVSLLVPDDWEKRSRKS